MNRQDRIEWMQNWCGRNGLILRLDGEVGFGRECVGVTDGSRYPDYEWSEDIWTPKDAYHKHECVAVLGRGEKAERQLYKWLKWFDEHGYSVERGRNDGSFHAIELMLGKDRFCRIVKTEGRS